MQASDDAIFLHIWKELEPNIQKIIDKRMSRAVYRYPAVVTDAENDTHYATVRLPFENTDMRLMNCTGKLLKIGDKVWIEQSYGMTNAFIAIKNDGKPWGW